MSQNLNPPENVTLYKMGGLSHWPIDCLNIKTIIIVREGNMPKFLGKKHLTNIKNFSIINITAKRLNCTYRGVGLMSFILALLLLSNPAYSQCTNQGGQDWLGMAGALGNSLGSLATASQSQETGLAAAKRAVRKCGCKLSECEKVKEGTYENKIKCLTCEDKAGKNCGLAEGQGSFTPEDGCSEAKIEKLCETYEELKGSGFNTTGAIVAGTGLALQLGAIALQPGCCDSCGTDSTGKQYTGDDLTRCLCNATGRNGKACIDPSTSTCTDLDNPTCQAQYEKLQAVDPSIDPSVLEACNCGKNNDLDPSGGWGLNERGQCVRQSNNNNVSEEDTPIEYADDGSGSGNNNANGNNAATASGASKLKGVDGTSSKLSLGGAAGASKAAADKKDKGKGDFADAGHGAGKGALSLAGSPDFMAGSGAGKGQDFKAKKGEKAKDIAKATDASIFQLVHNIYTNMVQANAIDSIRPMKKIDMKLDKKQKAKRA